MSFLSRCVCIGLVVTLAGCNGPETTSQPPSQTTFDRVNRANQAYIEYLTSGAADTAGQPSLTSPPSAAEPMLQPTPAQTQEPTPETNKELQQAIARARAEETKQSTWLQNRLNRRLLPLQEQIQATERKYEALQAAMERGDPKLTHNEQRRVDYLESKANKIRSKLNKLSSRYTDVFLEMDPIARGLRVELEAVEEEKTETRSAGIEKVMRNAHEALTNARGRAEETEQENRRLMLRFESFLTAVEQGPASSLTQDSDPDLRKVEKQLISAWKPAHAIAQRHSARQVANNSMESGARVDLTYPWDATGHTTQVAPGY